MTLPELEEQRALYHKYIVIKLEEQDYHAVADAAMDLRELQLKITMLKNNPFDKDTCNYDKFNESVK